MNYTYFYDSPYDSSKDKEIFVQKLVIFYLNLEIFVEWWRHSFDEPTQQQGQEKTSDLIQLMIIFEKFIIYLFLFHSFLNFIFYGSFYFYWAFYEMV